MDAAVSLDVVAGTMMICGLLVCLLDRTAIGCFLGTFMILMGIWLV